MRRTISRKWKESRQTPPCPHCRAGVDGVTAGLHWGPQDRCWQCFICGYRVYPQVLRLRSEAEIVAERVWDEIFDELDEEKSGHKPRD